MSKKQTVCTRDPRADAVVFTFANGKVLNCAWADVPEALRQHAGIMGLNHAIGDAFAGCGGDPDEAFEMACDKWDAIKRGSWSSRESSGGILAEALARVGNADVGAMREKVRALSDDDKKKLAKHPTVAHAIAAIRAERAAKAAASAPAIDLSELLK